jgi:hypothetical protein
MLLDLLACSEAVGANVDLGAVWVGTLDADSVSNVNTTYVASVLDAGLSDGAILWPRGVRSADTTLGDGHVAVLVLF